MEKYLLRIEGFGKVEHVSLDGGVFIDKCVFEDVTKELTKAREESKRIKDSITTLYEMENEEPRKRGLKDALEVINEIGGK